MIETGHSIALLVRNNGLDLLTNFIGEMVFEHDTVSHHFGKRGLHQVSFGDLLGIWKRFASMCNLHELINRSNDDDRDSRVLYEDMSSHEMNARVNLW